MTAMCFGAGGIWVLSLGPSRCDVHTKRREGVMKCLKFGDKQYRFCGWRGGGCQKSKKYADVIYGVPFSCFVSCAILFTAGDMTKQRNAARRAPRTPSNLRHIALNGSSGRREERERRGGANGHGQWLIADFVPYRHVLSQIIITSPLISVPGIWSTWTKVWFGESNVIE